MNENIEYINKIMSQHGLNFETIEVSEEKASISLFNNIGLNIGKLLLDKKNISFLTFDPYLNEITIEGGHSSYDEDEIIDLIKEFSYFPLNVKYNEINSVKIVNSEEFTSLPKDALFSYITTNKEAIWYENKRWSHALQQEKEIPLEELANHSLEMNAKLLILNNI